MGLRRGANRGHAIQEVIRSAGSDKKLMTMAIGRVSLGRSSKSDGRLLNGNVGPVLWGREMWAAAATALNARTDSSRELISTEQIRGPKAED